MHAKSQSIKGDMGAGRVRQTEGKDKLGKGERSRGPSETRPRLCPARSHLSLHNRRASGPQARRALGHRDLSSPPGPPRGALPTGARGLPGGLFSRRGLLSPRTPWAGRILTDRHGDLGPISQFAKQPKVHHVFPATRPATSPVSPCSPPTLHFIPLLVSLGGAPGWLISPKSTFSVRGTQGS